MRDGAQARAIRLGADVVRHEQAARAVLSNPSIAYTREGAGFTEFLQVEQLLPIFGSRGALMQAGAAATLAADAERDGRLWQLRADARALVARLLAEQEKLEASAVTVREVERIIALLRIREKEGEGSRFDRVRAEQELADARQISLDAAASAAEARAATRRRRAGRHASDTRDRQRCTSIAQFQPSRLSAPCHDYPRRAACAVGRVRALSSRS